MGSRFWDGLLWSYWVVSYVGIFLDVGSFGGGWHLLGNASSHRPGLYPLHPLHVRVSSSFIIFSDPCSLVYTRFSKGFELAIELYKHRLQCKWMCHVVSYPNILIYLCVITSDGYRYKLYSVLWWIYSIQFNFFIVSTVDIQIKALLWQGIQVTIIQWHICTVHLTKYI